MSDPEVDMLIDCEEDVNTSTYVINVGQGDQNGAISATWPYKSGVCLLCTSESSTSRSRDKLHTLTPDGLETICRNSEMRGKTDLLAYLDANPLSNHVVHNTCRAMFMKATRRLYYTHQHHKNMQENTPFAEGGFSLEGDVCSLWG